MAVELLARVHAEIDGRLAELRPAIAEYKRLLVAADAFDSGGRGSSPAARSPSRRQAPRDTASGAAGAAQLAIVAALEHGSHTLGELGVVTAMPGPDIREGLRRLLKAGTIARARPASRVAYALVGKA